MASVFNASGLNVQYISKPGLGTGKGGIIKFARVLQGNTAGAGTAVTDTAMLIESAQVQFSRQLQRKFFLNSDGMGYIVGLGTGTLQVQGLLGSATSFASVFGVDLNDPCKEVLQVTLDVSGMYKCTNGASTNLGSGVIILKGCVPQAVGVTTQLDQNGTLYYQATAAFEISGMEFNEANNNAAKAAAGGVAGVVAGWNAAKQVLNSI